MQNYKDIINKFRYNLDYFSGYFDHFYSSIKNATIHYIITI